MHTLLKCKAPLVIHLMERLAGDEAVMKVGDRARRHLCCFLLGLGYSLYAARAFRVYAVYSALGYP